MSDKKGSEGKGFLETIKKNIQVDVKKLWDDLVSHKLTSKELRKISCIVALKVRLRLLNNFSMKFFEQRSDQHDHERRYQDWCFLKVEHYRFDIRFSMIW